MKHPLFNMFSMVLALLTLASLVSIGNAAPVEGAIILGPHVELVKSDVPSAGPQLAVAVDLCAEVKHGNCLSNQHLIGNACYGIHDFNLSSIYFAGSSSCILYSLDSCDERSVAIKVAKSEADLGALHWNDWTASIRCVRPGQQLMTRKDMVIYPAELGATLSVSSAAAPPLGVAIDLCEDSKHRTCENNLHLDGDRCYEVHMKGLSSIYFEGHMTCVLYSNSDCEPEDLITLYEKADDLRKLHFNDKTRSISCHRYD